MTPMGTDAVAQLRRLLALLPAYADRGAVAVDDVAARLGTTPAQVRRDLRALEDYEDRGGFIEKFRVTLSETQLSVEARTFRRPMRLTREELRALELGLALLRHERSEQARGTVETALRHIRELLVVPGTPDGDIAGDQSAGDPALLEGLQEARRARRTVRMTYAPGDAAPAERRVQVYATVAAAGMWYAIGRNTASDAIRAYRLDRISAVALDDETYMIPADFDPDAWLRDGKVFRASEAPRLRVRYSAVVARWIAEREGVPVAEDGTLEVDHPLADPAWAVRHLLQYGAEVEVLEPAAVRTALVAALDALLDS
jgi:predicted DNA-binding transcriptional regulator YafY